jgi:hypothetical protein
MWNRLGGWALGATAVAGTFLVSVVIVAGSWALAGLTTAALPFATSFLSVGIKIGLTAALSGLVLWFLVMVRDRLPRVGIRPRIKVPGPWTESVRDVEVLAGDLKRLLNERRDAEALQLIEELQRSLIQSRRQIEAPRARRVTRYDPPPAPAAASGSSETQLPVRVDDVYFTITAPEATVPDSRFEILFWAHLEGQRQTVLARAEQSFRQLDRDDLLIVSDGPIGIQRGAELTVSIRIEGLHVQPSRKAITWTGNIGSASFAVKVSARVEPGAHLGVASVRLNGARIGMVHFVITVGVPAGRVSIPIETNVAMHKNAFACYASEDRDEVIARVQGMQAAFKGLKVFVDIVELRAGQHWEQELWRLIPASDVFYLFWCRHARQSEWVEKEWRCALERRGLDFIDPVPLEAPEYAVPPKELSAKHFNDPLLPFRKGQHA